MKLKIRSDAILSKKYAYSIKDSKQGKKYAKDDENIDFEKLNKGFYDEIEKKDIRIKNKMKDLKDIKCGSLKEFVYSNKNIPEQWRNKLGYQDDLLKVMVKDKIFLTYLGQGGDYVKTEASQKISEFPLSQRNEKKSLLPKLNTDEPRRLNKRMKTHITEVREDEPSLLGSGSRKNFRYNYLTGFKKEFTEKEIVNILDDFKLEYPIKDMMQSLYSRNLKEQNSKKDLLEKIEKKNKTTYNVCHTEANAKSKNLLTGHKSFIKVKRNIGFRETIFSNLIESANNKNVITSYKSRSNTLKNKDLKKCNNTYKKIGPFLNFDYETFNKKVEIQNSTINKYLESINFFGPYFSYCPPCRNKNLEFYKNLEPNQCIELIQFLKHARGKFAASNEKK